MAFKIRSHLKKFNKYLLKGKERSCHKDIMLQFTNSYQHRKTKYLFWRTECKDQDLMDVVSINMQRAFSFPNALFFTAITLFLMTSQLTCHDLWPWGNWDQMKHGLLSEVLHFTQISSWDHWEIMHLGEAERPNKCMPMLWCLTRIGASKLVPATLKEFCKYWRTYMCNILWKKRLKMDGIEIVR